MSSSAVTVPLRDISGVRAYRTVNPATGEILREFPPCADDQALDALAQAHNAFLRWRDTPLADRVGLFRRMIELIQADREELARLTTLEMGKPIAQSRMEVDIVVAMFRYYADNAVTLLADETVAVAGFTSVSTRLEPLGVVLGIEPWNVPMYQAMRATVPNLMLGNTVLLKPAEISAGSTLRFDALFRQAGFPDGVYRTTLLSIDQVATLIADPRVRGVTLTGSDRAGAAIGEQAGRHIKPVVLELGGSDAFVVLDSADVSKAASIAAHCRLAISGQVCISPKRVIVVDAVADAFIAHYVAVFAAQKVGDPFAADTTVGPLSTPEAAAVLDAQYRDALDKGATVLVPGGRIDGAGAYFQPAVLTGITPAMRLYAEEAFGPLGMIYRVADAEAAIALANDTRYGLGGTVFAEDLEQARRVAARLDTGSVGINGYLAGPVEISFGGTKASGVGRELGRRGIEQFANIKTYGIA